MPTEDNKTSNTAIWVAVIAGIFTLLTALITSGVFKSQSNLNSKVDTSKNSQALSNNIRLDSNPKTVVKPIVIQPPKVNKINLAGIWDYTMSWSGLTSVHGQMVVNDDNEGNLRGRSISNPHERLQLNDFYSGIYSKNKINLVLQTSDPTIEQEYDLRIINSNKIMGTFKNVFKNTSNPRPAYWDVPGQIILTKAQD